MLDTGFLMLDARYSILDTRCSNCTRNRGAALLVVLFIVMAITVLAFGFLTRSDVELACGQNMVLRTAMDYLAESGLQHARGLILNPQDVATGDWYWNGASGQQLVAGSNDYYDVAVTRLDPCTCNYQITSEAYRQKDIEKIGRSTLTAELRLDPAIAYCSNTNTTLSPRMTIAGDVNCAGNIVNTGTINGDVFANSLTGSISGQIKSPTNLALGWPSLNASDFSSNYYIETSNYSVEVVGSANFPSGNYSWSAGNPAGVYYRNGDINLNGGVNVNGGMLSVNGDMKLTGSNAITAVKNFPALLVKGDVTIEAGSSLDVNGLAVVNGQVRVSVDNGVLNIVGGLYTKGGLSEYISDYSGNGCIALLYNGPWQPSVGKVDGAFRFDGVDDYIQVPNSLSKLQITGDYKLEVWIKPEATQKAWAGIISKCSTDGSTNHWTLQFDNSSPKKLVIYHPSGSWDTGITLTNVANDWHHIKVVRNGNTMTSYLDGVPRTTGTWNVNPGSGNGHLNIGVDRTATSNYVYKGLIDDVRVYAGVGATNLLGYWKMDGAGCTANISASPDKAAIQVWPSPGTPSRWSPAAGAFFRSITRQ